jgi:hypothetical protein
MKNESGGVKRWIVRFAVIFIEDFLSFSNPRAKFLIRNIFRLSYDISIIRSKKKFIYKCGFKVLNNDIHNKEYIIDYYVIFLNFQSCAVERLKKFFNRTKSFSVLWGKIIRLECGKVIFRININSSRLLIGYS